MLLVTGITGHSGRYFLQELVKNKYEGSIRCIVRKTSDTSILDNSGLKIEKAVGDLNDQQFIDKAMIGVDTVMHIYNIHHSPMIVRAAINNDVKRVILVHTTGIYSKFKEASGEYKIIDKELTEMIRSSGIKLTILQPTMIYGDLCDHNMSKFIKMIDKLKIFPVINHGKCLIQPVNARDLGKAYYQALMILQNKSKAVYNLSGKKPISMIDAFKLISSNLEKKNIFISFPLWFGLLLAGMLKIITIGKVDYIEKVQRMSEDRCFLYEDAKKDFGYNPESFEDGIAREVKEYLNR